MDPEDEKTFRDIDARFREHLPEKEKTAHACRSRNGDPLPEASGPFDSRDIGAAAVFRKKEYTKKPFGLFSFS